MNTYFDKIFYINLEKDVARNEHMIAQFKKFGITNFERVDAISLTELPKAHHYRNFNKNDLKYLIGQLSCKASHLKCMSTAKERCYKKVLILEDDVTLLMDPHSLFIKNAAMLNENEWDMLYFGGLIESHFRNQIVCTHAYAVRHTVYDDIIYMGAASGMEIDNFYAKVLQHMSYNHNRTGKYNIRVMLPFNTIVQDKQFGSNIQS